MPSSVILRMRYEPETQTLIIVFRGGRRTYRYFDVPMEEWVAFRSSGSKGTFLNEIFKAQNHRYEKLSRSESFRLLRPKPTLAMQNEDRDREKDNETQQQAKFLEWGETRTLPEPRSQ
jgi:hypothetical protein